MAKNPHIHPEFTRVTAVRLSKALGASLALKIEEASVAQGSLYQNNTLLVDGTGRPIKTLALRRLAVGQTVNLVVHADRQAMVAFSWPMWENPCFAPTLVNLGTYFPLDVSNDPGTAPEANTTPRLPWTNPASGLLPPEQDLNVQISETGVLVWNTRGLVSSYTLQTGSTTANELYIALLTRTAESGRIIVPACGSQIETELRL